MMGFPDGSDSEEAGFNAEDPCSVLRSRRSPGEGNGNPLYYSCLENLHGQRILAGYSPQGRKEWDTTEWLMLSLFHF